MKRHILNIEDFETFKIETLLASCNTKKLVLICSPIKEQIHYNVYHKVSKSDTHLILYGKYKYFSDAFDAYNDLP
jgi:hypothetical protein